ncbi:MAG: aspartate-semialdehyde dehydrogenase [Endozoicomonadaceae bacterium]|nr:aspartate-semialdehyde dehydrogenase [Endozoicomonadaceae bacterium]
MMKDKYNIAIAGATGIVGESMLKLLEERAFPVNEVYPLASEQSAGNTVPFKGTHLIVESLATFDFSKADIALFSAGGAISKTWVPKATEQGCIVIDNTSCFRYEDDIPLVIPEVNEKAIAQYKNKKIIANPNCSTIQMLVALKPIYDAVGITRINVATYQSVSGAGRKGITELSSQTGKLLNGITVDPETFQTQIAFNAIPQIDFFESNGYTREEMKMVRETQKIFNDYTIKINPTCVRIPVFFGHAEAINIETTKKISAEEVKQLLQNTPGVTVVDTRKSAGYPTPVPHASGTNDVFVGRIREDISCDLGINMWVVADNVRKGAALNSIQIAEQLINHFIKC